MQHLLNDAIGRGLLRAAGLRWSGQPDPADGPLLRLLRLAARALGVPIASLVIAEAAQAFQYPPNDGLDAAPLLRLCRQCALGGEPLVARETPAGAHAVVPLRGAGGELLGALGVALPSPRAWTDEELATLADLAASAVSELELRVVTGQLEALRALHARVDAMLAGAPVGLGLVDRELRYLMVNGALADFDGAPATAHVGRTAGELLDETTAAALERCYRQVLETGVAVVDEDLTGSPRPGPHREWRATCYPVRSGDTIAGVGVVVTESTADREREELVDRLVRERAGRDAVVESIPDAFFIFDESGRAHANLRGLLLMGARDTLAPAQSEELLDIACAALEPAPPGGQEPRFTRLVRGGPFERQTIMVDKSTGQPIAVRIAVAPVLIDERVAGAVMLVVDMTPQKKLLHHLEEALEFRDRALAVISHDLRTPLTAMLTGAEILAERARLSPSEASVVRRMQSAGRRMTELLASLVAFARGRFGVEMPVQRIPVDLGRLAGEVVEEFDLAAPGRLRLEVSGEVQGLWDPARLSELLSNLVGNALHHGKDGETVLVTVTGGPQVVTLAVSNRGAPIPRAVLRALFQPFRPGGTDAHRGLGLGLYIVEQIATAHGGQVIATSGEVTTFTVTLPREPARPPASSP